MYPFKISGTILEGPQLKEDAVLAQELLQVWFHITAIATWIGYLQKGPECGLECLFEPHFLIYSNVLFAGRQDWKAKYLK